MTVSFLLPCLSILVISCSSRGVVSTEAPVRVGFEEGLRAYEHGDYAVALKQFRPLAENGDADAQFHLGGMYFNGQGVPQSYNEALKWFRKAAEQGHARAQNNLGGMYNEGHGVPQDDEEAARWYRKAAEQGLGYAQYNLGFKYGRGEGVPRDYVLAHMWFSLAAKNGIQTAIKLRDAAAAFLTPAQIEDALRLAKEWKASKSQ